MLLLGWLLIGLGQFAWTRPPPFAEIAGRVFVGVVLPVALGVVVAVRGVRRGGSLSRWICCLCLAVCVLVGAMFIVAAMRG